MGRSRACRLSVHPVTLHSIARPMAGSRRRNRFHHCHPSSAASTWRCASTSITTRKDRKYSRTDLRPQGLSLRSGVRGPTLAFLPDSASFLWHHCRTWFAVEGLLKFRHVRNYAIGAVLFWGVRINGGIDAFGFVAGVFAPALSVADEEALLGSESVDRIKLLASSLILPGNVGQHQAAQVSDIFSQGELAIDLDVIHRYVLRILLGNTTGALVKLFTIFRCPPVTQIAMSIELTAFVVEAVGEFMPNGGSGIAIVRSIVRFGIE